MAFFGVDIWNPMNVGSHSTDEQSHDQWVKRKVVYARVGQTTVLTVVSRFLSSRFHAFDFSNIMLRSDLLIFEVSGPLFKIAGEMCWLQAYFDSPVYFTLSKGLIIWNLAILGNIYLFLQREKKQYMLQYYDCIFTLQERNFM